MRQRSGPTMEHRVVAQRLRHLREAARVSLAQAASAIDAHPATVRRIELAETQLDAGHVERLLKRYAVSPRQRDQIMTQLADASSPGWWHPWRRAMESGMGEWIGTESSASIIRLYHAGWVPDLLQTPAYARHLHMLQHPDASEALREKAVDLLVHRQQRVAERNTALWAVLHASALHTRVGNNDVMREQHDALRETAGRTRHTVQITPLNGRPHPLLSSPALRLMRVPAPQITDQLVLERPGGIQVLQGASVEAWRVALDTAAVAASPPGAPLALPLLEDDHG